MSSCSKCGTEYKVLKDLDDTRYRRPCACEADEPCADCKRGRVTHVILAGDGSPRFACSKHGLDEAADWEPAAPKASPGKAPGPAPHKAPEKFSGLSYEGPLYVADQPCKAHESALLGLPCVHCKGLKEVGRIQGHATLGPRGRSFVVTFVIPENQAVRNATLDLTKLV